MNRYLLLVLLLMSSCAPFILINDNYYRALTDEQFAELRQYGDTGVVDSASKYLVEITVDDIVQAMKQAKYTWLHQWVPYCPGETCMPLYYYDNILQQYKDLGVQLLMVSSSYTYNSVKKQVPYYGGEVYVLKDEIYGHNHGKNVRKFETELRAKTRTGVGILHKDMLYKGDSLIYTTNLMTAAKMDSVIRGEGAE